MPMPPSGLTSIGRWPPPSHRRPRGAPRSCSIQGATPCGPPQGGTLTLVCAAGLCPGEVLLHREGGQPLTLAVATRDAEPSPTVAPIAQAARQALVGKTLSVLPAFV